MKCIKCGKREADVDGLCSICYINVNCPDKWCKKCNNRIAIAKGMCRRCYEREYRKENKEIIRKKYERYNKINQDEDSPPPEPSRKRTDIIRRMDESLNDENSLFLVPEVTEAFMSPEFNDDIMFCPNCGSANLIDKDECKFCGEDLCRTG